MKIPLVALFLAFLCGCGPNPPQATELESWFYENQGPLQELAILGIEHPSLRRVEPSSSNPKQFYGQPDAASVEAARQAINILAELETDFVAYFRNGSFEERPIIAVVVPYYRWGLSLGGYSKGFIFFPDYGEETREPGHYSSYRYLGVPGWFIETSDSR